MGRVEGKKKPAIGKLLMTVADAAEALSVSQKHIRRLIYEADNFRRSQWRWGRELINLAPAQAQRRVVRVNVAAVVPAAVKGQN